VEVAPGLFQLKTVIPNNPLGYVLPYLITGTNGHTIVDTGWNCDEAFDDLKKGLRDLHVNFLDIKTVVLTHLHPDHFGLTQRIKERSGAEVVYHEKEATQIGTRYDQGRDKMFSGIADWLRANGVNETELGQMEAFAQRHYANMTFPPVADRTAKTGEMLHLGDRHFEVVWTPGHTPGHLCLYQSEEKILITGDTILPTISPNISLHPHTPGNPLGEFIQSLHTLEQLPADLILPAHERIIENLSERARELIAHHEERLGEMITAIGDGEPTPYEIASQVKWNVGSWDKMNVWLRRYALSETLAHLEYARLDGRIVRRIDNGIVRFARASVVQSPKSKVQSQAIPS
jgi:glyoxylase-like metal-dependent hydrolase (beta-lactamase superfamily II)